MAMTRKDYQLIADTIQSGAGLFRSNLAHASFATEVAITLNHENANFKPVVFIEACKPRWIPGTKDERHWDAAVAIAKEVN